jgi:hypothetical protein
MSFPFNPLRISVGRAASSLYGAWVFKTRHIFIGKKPEIKMVLLSGPFRTGKYSVTYQRGEKQIKWSTDNFETAWRAAWRRLMKEDKNVIQS